MPTDLIDTFHEAMARNRPDMTIADLSRETGIEYQKLKRWLGPRHGSPRIEDAIVMATAINATLDEAFQGNESAIQNRIVADVLLSQADQLKTLADRLNPAKKTRRR